MFFSDFSFVCFFWLCLILFFWEVVWVFFVVLFDEYGVFGCF